MKSKESSSHNFISSSSLPKELEGRNFDDQIRLRKNRNVIGSDSGILIIKPVYENDELLRSFKDDKKSWALDSYKNFQKTLEKE